MAENEFTPKSFFVRLTLYIVLIFAAVFACSFFGVLVLSFWTDAGWIDMAKEHASAAVGLPIASVTAFLIVSVLQISTGKIELECPGFKLHGASGPIILWIASFLAMAMALKVLW